MNSVDGIESAFSQVKASVKKAMEGDEASKERSFQDIFALNNQVGRMAREQPSTMARMKELQACVNMITVGLKYDKRASVREGLTATSKSIKALKREFSTSP